MAAPKIFCIGFQKTGTTTLAKALEVLGYKVFSDTISNITPLVLKEDWNGLKSIIDKHDAVQDNPWPLLYREMDEWYPNAKFILTDRDEKKWIKSVVNHFGTKHTDMRQWIYGDGTPVGNEEAYLQKFKDHNKEVRQYFAKRPNDLLEVCWQKEATWEPLCEFLGREIPAEPFPHENKGAYTVKDKAVKFFKKKWGK